MKNFLGLKNLFRGLKFLFRGTKKPGPCLSVVDICPPTKTTPYTLSPGLECPQVVDVHDTKTLRNDTPGSVWASTNGAQDRIFVYEKVTKENHKK